jgi:hypothetical protein
MIVRDRLSGRHLLVDVTALGLGAIFLFPSVLNTTLGRNK